MKQRCLLTDKGKICYWINDKTEEEITLVFLPGLTADHRLFAKQIRYFADRYRVVVWDAPGHGLSRPFELTFSLLDKAGWLHEILQKEGVKRPVMIGQSMGGYVAQAYAELYPGEMAGFVSIDSAPLQRCYVTKAEIWLLKRMEPVYRLYPRKLLLQTSVKGIAQTEYGQKLMRQMWLEYDKAEFSRLAGHGYRILAEAMEADRPYKITCPALLICGEKDQAGSVKRYNRNWTKKTGIPLVWIPDAGHNSNTDNPEKVNALIEEFIDFSVCNVNEYPGN